MRKGDVQTDLQSMADILWRYGLLAHHTLNSEKNYPVTEMPLSLNQYIREIVENNNYTFLLYDGSSIQVGYKYDSQERIISHKLSFFFSPLSLRSYRNSFLCLIKGDEPVVQRGSKPDLIELMQHFLYYSEYPHENEGASEITQVESVVARGFWPSLTWVYGVRFDFDSSMQNQAEHPQSHATIFDNECRIAASHFFDLRRFFLLVFAHLWPFHKEDVIPEIQRRIPPRFEQQDFLPNDYVEDYGAFLSLLTATPQ